MSQLKNIKLNTPTYREIIPSSNKEVIINPFKVGDEKILLMASESQDTTQMIDALKKVINNCVQGATVDDMASFDVEYLFIKIRSVSVGEVAKISLTCPECETANPVDVDLSKTSVKGVKEFKTNVKLTEELIFTMKLPHVDSMAVADSNPDSIVKFIASNVEKVFYGEETIEITPADIEDVVNIINQLTSAQFKELQDYIINIPKMSLDIEYDCTHCNKNNKQTLEGLSDFF